MFGISSKSFLLSKTLWGLAIGVLAEFLKSKGYVVDTGGLTNDVVALLGTALSAYGRVTASQPLHVVAPSGSDDPIQPPPKP